MFKIVSASAAAISLAIAVGHHQGSADDPPPPPVQQAAETSDDLFADHWTRAAGVVLLMAAMAETMQQPKPVATERIAVAPIDKPVAEVPKAMTIEHPRPKPRDICQRHGMRKVITRGGKSWRCK